MMMSSSSHSRIHIGIDQPLFEGSATAAALLEQHHQLVAVRNRELRVLAARELGAANPSIPVSGDFPAYSSTFN